MYVKCLDWVIYAPTGWDWKSHKLWQPAWDDIDCAIRRLDRFQYPFVWLWGTEDESKHALDGTAEVLQIVGGEGVWWLAGSFEERFQRRIDYPERGEREVQVWTSDQGFADAERHICRDIEVVVHAARYYAEHGGFDPTLRWEEGP